MKRKGIVPRAWRLIKRIFLILFAAQLIYIILLKWINPPFTLTMASSWFSLIGTKNHFRHRWVDYREISPQAKLAVMAGEDQLFPVHHGFDFKSIKIAWKHNEKNRHVWGASTISQQVARNVFLWQGRTWLRKGMEVYFTFMIEWIWGKKRILEVYLNDVQMGNGIFGIEAASESYYGRHASQLDRSQAALIAAALPNPVFFKVRNPTGYLLRRQTWIMGQMVHLEGDPPIENLIRKP
ncbi:MAG TPA: monofunctional biosynthetic peptidoglycan transglycosylase [Chitinophagaceae bacterium]|nr:monofunctional biosynthetic peptidoglycan transglycosylase [Chitinophagaceae bacterium]